MPRVTQAHPRQHPRFPSSVHTLERAQPCGGNTAGTPWQGAVGQGLVKRPAGCGRFGLALEAWGPSGGGVGMRRKCDSPKSNSGAKTSAWAKGTPARSAASAMASRSIGVPGSGRTMA
jgi:hypothetical protein